MDIRDNNERKIYELLLEIKKTNPEIYPQITNLLEYIYKDIKEYFTTNIQLSDLSSSIINRIDHRTGWLSSYNDSNYKNYLNRLFSDYVHGEHHILDNLSDMCKNNDKRFINKFFESIEVPLEMMRRGIYDQSPIYSYIYNLYTILSGYHANTDSYENFTAIVDDVADIFILFTSKKDEWGVIDRTLSRKDIIDDIVSIKKYKDFETIRNALKKNLHEIGNAYILPNVDYLKKVFNMFHTLEEDLEKYKNKDIEIDSDLIDEITKDIASLLDENHEYVDVFYCRDLILKDHYRFIKKGINKIEDCPRFKNEIFENIQELDYSMFEFLSNERKRDSFIDCMTSVFDSNSYQELFSKLHVLKEVNKQFLEGDKTKTLSLYELMNKESGDNYFFDPNITNKKPDKIIERMELEYEKNGLLDQFLIYKKEYESGTYRNIPSFIKTLTSINNYKREPLESSSKEESEKEKLRLIQIGRKGIFSRFNKN